MRAGLYKVWMAGLALGWLAACETPAPDPDPRPPEAAAPAAPAAPVLSAQSRELAAYYGRIERGLLDRGLLRTAARSRRTSALPTAR